MDTYRFISSNVHTFISKNLCISPMLGTYRKACWQRRQRCPRRRPDYRYKMQNYSNRDGGDVRPHTHPTRYRNQLPINYNHDTCYCNVFTNMGVCFCRICDEYMFCSGKILISSENDHIGPGVDIMSSF